MYSYITRGVRSTIPQGTTTTTLSRSYPIVRSSSASLVASLRVCWQPHGRHHPHSFTSWRSHRRPLTSVASTVSSVAPQSFPTGESGLDDDDDDKPIVVAMGWKA